MLSFMELIVPKQLHNYNTIVFPKELRDAIPWHSARSLVFDSVTGTPTVTLVKRMSPARRPICWFTKQERLMENLIWF